MKPRYTPSNKPFFEMTRKERDEYVRQFDQEFIADAFRPMTPAERTRWERLKRKRAGSAKTNGAKLIAISVEPSLLEASDALARRKKISRASLIARGLRALLVAEGIEFVEK